MHFDYTGEIVPASTLLPIVAGFVYYRQIDKPLRVLLGYLCFALTVNIIAIVLAGHNTNNMPLLHVYTAIELVLVVLYYKYAFADAPKNRWLNLMMIAYPLLCIVNFAFFQSLYKFNTYTRPLEALIIIVLSSIYLGQTLARTTAAGRWVAGGFLLYFCSSAFQFIFSNVVSRYATKAQRLLIWDIHATFVLIMYILFFVAILNGRSKR